MHFDRVFETEMILFSVNLSANVPMTYTVDPGALNWIELSHSMRPLVGVRRLITTAYTAVEDRKNSCVV